MRKPDPQSGSTALSETMVLPANEMINPDTVRYLSDLWENLKALQELLAHRRKE
jgi:hypothetical protein